MKTQRDGIAKAFKPYAQEEIALILSMIPTGKNIYSLAKSLGRTRDAILMIYQVAYHGPMLRNNLERRSRDGSNNVFDKIVRAKRDLDIVLGHKESER